MNIDQFTLFLGVLCLLSIVLLYFVLKNEVKKQDRRSERNRDRLDRLRRILPNFRFPRRSRLRPKQDDRR